MKKIAIIGLGNIGLRHLQGALCYKSKYEIYGIEKNEERLNSLRDDYGENCSFYSDISMLPQSVDVIVIATTSSVRRTVLENIFDAGINVSYIVFEKVLFQSEEDYIWAEKQLVERNIKAWINCVRRETQGYKMLKSKLDDVDKFYVRVLGGEWGLCCNGIHFLDIIKYLSDEDSVELLDTKLELPIVDSKRVGFKECYGSFKGKTGKCKSFSIECINDDSISTLVYIYCEKFTMIIDEEARVAFYKNTDEQEKHRIIQFDFPYVSEMAGNILNDILEKGTCSLPEYDKSMNLHLDYIKIISDFFNSNGMEVEKCPIT